MLTKTSLKYVKNCVKRVDFWGCSPYAWDEQTCRMKYVYTKRRKYFWYLDITAAILYECYVMGQCVYVSHFDENSSTTMQIYMEYSVLAYAIPVALHLGIILRRHELLEFVNQFMSFFEQYKSDSDSQIEEGESRGKKEMKNGCEKFQSIFVKSGTLICCINLVLIFRTPARPVLLTAVLPNAANLKPWFILPFAAVHSYLWWSMWANMYFVALPMYAYMYPLRKIIDEHSVTSFPRTETIDDDTGERVRVQTAPQKWSPETIARRYRCIQLLQTKANYVYSIILPGHKLLFVLLAIRSIYGAIKMTGGVAILLSVVAVLVCFYLRITFKVMAQIYEGSLECLFTWNRYRKYPWFSRFLKSCKPVRMEIGSLYFVDRGMVFTLLSLIIDNTITLVLSE